MSPHVFLLFLIVMVATGCGRLDALPYQPTVLPSDWCSVQPCMQLFGMVISQPSSSLLVLLAALVALALAQYFARTTNGLRSRWWFAVSMAAGGVGALLAGISYQAFGFELKCAGRAHCVWTNWWELGYELLTVLGASALLMAVAASCLTLAWQRSVRAAAVLNTLVYVGVLLAGVITLDRFLLSFEMMVLFTAPAYILLLLFHVFRYFTDRSALMKRFVVSWLLLFATLGAFFAYASAGITGHLWAKGIWFSENDVLHVGMILWMGYIWRYLGPMVKDGSAVAGVRALGTM